MKNIKLFMCLAFIALTFPLWAQTNTEQNPQDTVLIRLQGRNQVHIIGKRLRTLATYERADSLKAYFFSDLNKSLQNGSFPEMPKRIHYFVSQQGKRRLKAEINEEFAAKFDLGYEKTRMNLDLPPLHYTIYDLPENVEIHFFLEDSAATELAATTMLSPALQAVKKEGKKANLLSTYRLEKTGFGFENRNPKKNKVITLEFNGGLGGMLFGSQLSPVISYDLYITLPSRRFLKHRFGASYNGFLLTDFKEGKFENLNTGTSLKGYYQFKINSTGQHDSWFGLSAGYVGTDKSTGLKRNEFIWGLISTQGRNSFSADMIPLGNKEAFLLFTYKRFIL
ncbi:hypothetical protein I5M27_17610 [Adhaeribacter sp. BT258]|uniref:Uncharacterized protein n=1 Tax=Adhaeribacter terrigena TaxID=2793070 RepID=A0ABS1C684_9BACT|nr:hypothetical protein [Adhaeribacter terrigena]MBK0404813.1 hypothetical protein [Adhaeribacter terrigena]